MKGISRKPRQSAGKSGDPDYCPDAGDFIWLEFDPQAGCEQAGRRPALVLSPHRYNKLTGRCIACPVTSRVKGFPFEVLIDPEHHLIGAVLSDHVKSVDWVSRRAQFISRAPESALHELRGKLKALLAIP
jgi:mRNA interferase MazF